MTRFNNFLKKGLTMIILINSPAVLLLKLNAVLNPKPKENSYEPYKIKKSNYQLHKMLALCIQLYKRITKRDAKRQKTAKIEIVQIPCGVTCGINAYKFTSEQ